MALIVQKYGGTSVGNPDRIKNVAARVAKYRAQGDQIVVVVSAMSGVTDGLIKLAKEIMPLPSEQMPRPYRPVGARNSVGCVELQVRPSRHGATMIGP